MTRSSAFVWDTTGPLHAAAADRLAGLLVAAGRGTRHQILPVAVLEEIRSKGFDPAPDFDEVSDIDTLEGIIRLAQWQDRLGSTETDGRDPGEAWVATLAEELGAVAIVDDGHARKVVDRWAAFPVHGVLWAISRGVTEGRVDRPQAYDGLCRLMMEDHGMGRLRWPLGEKKFSQWFVEHEEELRG